MLSAMVALSKPHAGELGRYLLEVAGVGAPSTSVDDDSTDNITGSLCDRDAELLRHAVAFRLQAEPKLDYISWQALFGIARQIDADGRHAETPKWCLNCVEAERPCVPERFDTGPLWDFHGKLKAFNSEAAAHLHKLIRDLEATR